MYEITLKTIDRMVTEGATFNTKGELKHPNGDETEPGLFQYMGKCYEAEKKEGGIYYVEEIDRHFIEREISYKNEVEKEEDEDLDCAAFLHEDGQVVLCVKGSKYYNTCVTQGLKDVSDAI